MEHVERGQGNLVRAEGGPPTPFQRDDQTSVWVYEEPWDRLWCFGDPEPSAADDPCRWSVAEVGAARDPVTHPACPSVDEMFGDLTDSRLLDDSEGEGGEAVKVRLIDGHTGEAWELVRRYEVVAG